MNYDNMLCVKVHSTDHPTRILQINQVIQFHAIYIIIIQIINT